MFTYNYIFKKIEKNLWEVGIDEKSDNIFTR